MTNHAPENIKPYTLVTEMSNLEAKAYFRESKHYVNFDLPSYFNFDNVLLYASTITMNKNLADVCEKDEKGKPIYPGNYANVNHVILSNKDGSFAWRPMQIIHPVLYADLVNLITEEDAWNDIKNLFNRQQSTSIECISIPLKSNTDDSSRAAQVSKWWDRIEQESLRKSLDYKFMFQTDISNCYPSIYTHSLEWALCPGGRTQIKSERAAGKSPKNLGTEIDFRLKQMNEKQTIGIPQGSTLMDFVAEMVLAGTDIELHARIKSDKRLNSETFSILRYRDDYRIFSNEYQVGHEIMKILNNVLAEWNMKMNTGKTSETSDIIAASIKSEKMEEIYTAPVKYSYQKSAMRIYMLSKRYPNSGLVAKNLTDFFDRIHNIKGSSYIDYEVVVAIITMVAYYSPRYMSQAASIISELVKKAGDTLNRKTVIEKIINKFSDIPNTDFIDVWLQRITDAEDVKNYDFSGSITKRALGFEDNSLLWNSEWLPLKEKELLNNEPISTLSDLIEEGTFSPVIDRKEFELYRLEEYDT